MSGTALKASGCRLGVNVGLRPRQSHVPAAELRQPPAEVWGCRAAAIPRQSLEPHVQLLAKWAASRAVPRLLLFELQQGKRQWGGVPALVTGSSRRPGPADSRCEGCGETENSCPHVSARLSAPKRASPCPRKTHSAYAI